jgi:asparagine synthase (glutamine-hydrolysing)
MPLDFVRTAEEPIRVPDAAGAQAVKDPFVLIEKRDGRSVVSGAASCTLGRETPLWDGKPDGIFARWAWDGQQLELANDRYGLQPLYYFSHEGRAALSPSVSKLIELGAPSELDVDALAVFLHLGFFIGDETPFRAIRAVPPGARARWSEGVLTVEGRRPKIAPVSLGREEALGAYVAAFREAVQRRAPAKDDDVVLLLSGGRDSRHILFELQRAGQAPSRCLTVEYEGGDLSVARLVARELGIEHVAVPAGGFSLASERRKNDLTNFCADEHTWVLPAADYLAPRRTTIYDGIGGDVLSAGLFLSPKRLRLYAEGRFLELARDISVGSVIPPMFRRGLRERLAAALPLERIAGALESMAGEPNPLSSFFFWSRTRREIALGPYRMLCGNAVVHSPYVDARIFDMLMGMPAAAFVDHTFHTDAINLAFPEYRHLPYAGKAPDGTLGWRRGAFVALDVLRSSLAPGNHLVDRGFLFPRLSRALVDPTYRRALVWLAPLTVYLEQLGELQGVQSH